VVGRFNDSPSLKKDALADELSAIVARPSARIKNKKVGTTPGPPRALSNLSKNDSAPRTSQPNSVVPFIRPLCPHCGTRVGPANLKRHLEERCPILHPHKTARVATRQANRDGSYGRSARNTLPWVCPECFDMICGSEVAQSVALEMWRTHARTFHVTVGANVQHSGPIQARAPVAFFVCAKCGEQVKEDCKGLHSLKCHPSNKQPQSLDVPVHHLSFALLPPGEWDIRHVIEHYRKESHNLPSDLLGRRIDNSRLVSIASLRPLRCYIGKESGSGYVVFEFSSSGRVVLECPFEGNATYVLSGDWKAMVRHSKLEMRRRFPHSYLRIVHKGDWLSRIRSSIRNYRRSPT
jgi:hypothetical protein